MNQLYMILILVFLLCFTIYQWWFQSTRFKQMSEKDQDKIDFYNKPLSWMTYSLVLFVLVLGLIGYNIMRLIEAVMNLEL